MSRFVRKPPFCHPSIIKRVRDAIDKGLTNVVIKVYSRTSVIFPIFINVRFAVYNGKSYIPVNVNENMVGHKFGEFSPTRKFTGHGGDKKATRR